MPETLSLYVPCESTGDRVDKWLSMQEEITLTRSALQDVIDTGMVIVNNKPISKSYRLHEGETVYVTIPDPTPLALVPENIPLDIVYEDDDLLVVNKPKGMVVHPAPGHPTGTLVHALLYHCGDNLSGIGGVARPGIVHRIDRLTSGLLLVAKNDMAHQGLSAQIAEHSFMREYRALALGHFREESGTIDSPIGRHPTDRKKMSVTQKNAKPAITHYIVIEQYPSVAYLRLNLETGRTHQIRVHLSYVGHPVLGDDVYGKAVRGIDGQCLHAAKIGFIHPRTGQYLEFSSELPQYFKKLLLKYNSGQLPKKENL